MEGFRCQVVVLGFYSTSSEDENSGSYEKDGDIMMAVL